MNRNGRLASKLLFVCLKYLTSRWSTQRAITCFPP